MLFRSLTYTQKSFWDIYKKSKPFAESNYNPTLGLGTPITRRDKLVGLGMLQFEHESNGRGGDSSRSWNRISLTGIFEFNRRFSGELKLWIPMGLSDNPDYVRYGGYGQAAVNYKSLDERVRLSLLVVKRGGWNLNANLRLEAGYRLSKRSNQYLFLQYYNGYAESMIEYRQFHSYWRIGFAIKPRGWTIF